MHRSRNAHRVTIVIRAIAISRPLMLTFITFCILSFVFIVLYSIFHWLFALKYICTSDNALYLKYEENYDIFHLVFAKRKAINIIFPEEKYLSVYRKYFFKCIKSYLLEKKITSFKLPIFLFSTFVNSSYSSILREVV